MHTEIRRIAVAAASVLLLALVGPALAQPATASAPASPASIATLDLTGLAGQVAHITLAQIAAMPHQSVTVTWHGATSTFQGVPLTDLLTQVSAPRGEALRGRELADVVVVTAQDGYRVVLALSDTEASIRGNRIIVADQVDGHALAGNDGSLRLVVEGDLKPARSARQVQRIELRRLD